MGGLLDGGLPGRGWRDLPGKGSPWQRGLLRGGSPWQGVSLEGVSLAGGLPGGDLPSGGVSLEEGSL